MTETRSIHAPSEGGPATLEAATTTAPTGPATLEAATKTGRGTTPTDTQNGPPAATPAEAATTPPGADQETSPGLWDAPGDSHNGVSDTAANQADGPASDQQGAATTGTPGEPGRATDTHPSTEDFTTDGATTPKRQPFRPLRLTPYDANGNKIAGWGRRIGAFAIDWGSLTVIELIFIVVYGFAGVGRIATFLDSAVCIAYFTLSVGSSPGQTPGMRLTGIAVIDEETGRPPTYPKAFLRFFLESFFMSIFMLPIIVMFYFALYDDKRQMVHDKAVGTVVIETANEPVPQAANGATGAPAPAMSVPSTGANPPKRPPLTSHLPIEPIARWLRKYGTRLVVTLVATAGIVIAAVVVTNKIAATNAYNHSPARAATAYLTALSGKDVPALLASAGIVTPTDVAPGVNVLLSESDIKTEFAASHSAAVHVSDVVVQSTHTTRSGTAIVTLTYHANNQNRSVTYSLISLDKTPSGWVVQVYPSRLDIDVPTGDTTVTLDGMKLALDGQMAHAYIFPSVATVSVPASAIWQSATRSVDTRNQNPNGDPQEVSFVAQLLPSAQTSAVQAVASQIDNCLAATSLTPANCPNEDIPESTSAGDTYSNISWSGLGQPTAGMAATVDPSGAVTVWGSMAAEVNYTDTSNTDPWIGPISSPNTDGPTNYYFAYPLTWSGTGWTLGSVAVANSPLKGQPTSTYSSSSA